MYFQKSILLSKHINTHTHTHKILGNPMVITSPAGADLPLSSHLQLHHEGYNFLLPQLSQSHQAWSPKDCMHKKGRRQHQLSSDLTTLPPSNYTQKKLLKASSIPHLLPYFSFLLKTEVTFPFSKSLLSRYLVSSFLFTVYYPVMFLVVFFPNFTLCLSFEAFPNFPHKGPSSLLGFSLVNGTNIPQCI